MIRWQRIARRPQGIFYSGVPVGDTAEKLRAVKRPPAMAGAEPAG